MERGPESMGKSLYSSGRWMGVMGKCTFKFVLPQWMDSHNPNVESRQSAKLLVLIGVENNSQQN
jgi:hypothetical protein